MRFQAPLVTLLRATSVNIKAVVWMTFVILFFEKLRANIKMKRFNLFCSWAAPYPWTTQTYSKEAVAHVQKYLTKNEVPAHLFEVKIFICLVSFLCRSFTLDWNLFPSFLSHVCCPAALHRRDLYPFAEWHLSKVCRKRQVHSFLSVEESRA